MHEQPGAERAARRQPACGDGSSVSGFVSRIVATTRGGGERERGRHEPDERIAAVAANEVGRERARSSARGRTRA